MNIYQSKVPLQGGPTQAQASYQTPIADALGQSAGIGSLTGLNPLNSPDSQAPKGMYCSLPDSRHHARIVARKTRLNMCIILGE